MRLDTICGYTVTVWRMLLYCALIKIFYLDLSKIGERFSKTVYYISETCTHGKAFYCDNTY
jgi:hypothetical protein